MKALTAKHGGLGVKKHMGETVPLQAASMPRHGITQLKKELMRYSPALSRVLAAHTPVWNP